MARPIGSPGSMTVDWEERVNPDRLRTYRLARARAALDASELGVDAALRLQQHPLRHEHPHRRVGPRQDDPLRPADSRRRARTSGTSARRPSTTGSTARGCRPRTSTPGWSDCAARSRPDAGLFRAAAREIAAILRAEGVADMPLGVDIVEPPMLAALARRGDRRSRRPAGHARRPRGQVDRRDHAAQHRLRDGRRRLPAHLRAAEAGRPRERARGRGHEAACSTSGSEHVDNINAVSGERCSPHPHVFSDRIIRPGDQAFFDIIQTFVGYKTCYYRTFVVGTRHGRPARRLQAGARVDRRLDRADAAGRDHRPGREGLAQGRGVRLLERDGVLRAPVRPQRRAVPPRAADHQPAQLARPSGRDQGGDGHRPRDLLPGADGFSAARIEEEVVVTADGPQIITRFPSAELFVANAY